MGRSVPGRVARSVRLPPEVDARLVALAAELGVSINETLERLIRHFDEHPAPAMTAGLRLPPVRSRADRDRDEVTPRLKGAGK